MNQLEEQNVHYENKESFNVFASCVGTGDFIYRMARYVYKSLKLSGESLITAGQAVPQDLSPRLGHVPVKSGSNRNIGKPNWNASKTNLGGGGGGGMGGPV